MSAPREKVPVITRPGNLPPPGSVPKLPQSIFNLEQKGVPADAGNVRRPDADRE